MSGIKKIFGGGGGEDDEVMYGDGGKGKDPVLNTSGEPFSGSNYTTTADHGTGRGAVSGQDQTTMDPAREDDQHYGSTTAHEGEPTYGTTSTGREGEPAYGTASTARGVEEQRYGEPGTTTESTEDSKSKGGLLSKIMPSKGNSETERATEGDTTRSTADDTNYGRDAAIAGGVGTAGAGAGAYEYSQRDDPQTTSTTGKSDDTSKKGGLLSKLTGSKNDDKSNTTTTLGDQQYRETAPTTQSSSGMTDPVRSTGGAPFGESGTQRGAEDTRYGTSTADDTHYGRDAAIAGGIGTAGAGAAAYGYSRDNDRQAETETSGESKKPGLLSKILGSKSDDKSKQTYDDTTTGTTSSGNNYGRDVGTASSGNDYGRDTGTTTSGNNYGRDAAMAGGVGALGAGAGTAAYESGSSQNRGDDLSGATYTERSYPLGTTSQTTGPTTTTTTSTTTTSGGSTYTQPPTTTTTGDSYNQPPTSTTGQSYTQPGTSAGDTHYGRDAAMGAGTAGVLGAGTYAATRDRGTDQSTPITADRTIQNPSELDRDPVELDSTSRMAPQSTDRHMPGEFPTEVNDAPRGGEYIKVQEDPQTTTYDSRTDLVPEKAGLLKTQPSAGMSSTTDSAAQGETHYGRDAALGGAGAAAIGGGAYAASRDDPQQSAYTSPTTQDNSTMRAAQPYTGTTSTTSPVQPYTGTTSSTAPTTDSSTSAPYQSNIADKIDPRTTQSTSQRTEDTSTSGRDGALAGATAATAGGAGYAGYSSTRSDEPSSQYTSDSPDNRVSTDPSGTHHLHKKSEERLGEKKQGFISKLLHRGDKNKENDEPVGEGSHFSDEGTTRQMQAKNTTGYSDTAGTTGATGASSMGTSEMGTSGTSTSGGVDPRTGMPVDDRGMIVLVNEGADPDAHHVTISGDHSGVFEDKE